MEGIELNLEGVKFRLSVSVPASDDFEGMKKSWEEFYALAIEGIPEGGKNRIQLLFEVCHRGGFRSRGFRPSLPYWLHYLHGIWQDKQGSHLKADYEVSREKDAPFQNSRNQIQEKDNRSEAPRRQYYSSRHSRRFKE